MFTKLPSACRRHHVAPLMAVRLSGCLARFIYGMPWLYGCLARFIYGMPWLSGYPAACRIVDAYALADDRAIIVSAGDVDVPAVANSLLYQVLRTSILKQQEVQVMTLPAGQCQWHTGTVRYHGINAIGRRHAVSYLCSYRFMLLFNLGKGDCW